MDRFQLWAPDYAKLIEPSRETAKISIDAISKVPIALFAGKRDKVADPVDAQWIRDTLKPETMIHY